VLSRRHTRHHLTCGPQHHRAEAHRTKPKDGGAGGRRPRRSTKYTLLSLLYLDKDLEPRAALSGTATGSQVRTLAMPSCPREGRCKPPLPSRLPQAPDVWWYVGVGVGMCCGWYPARSAGYAAFFLRLRRPPVAPARLSRLCCSPPPTPHGSPALLRHLLPRRPGPAGRDAPYGLACPTPLDSRWPALAMSGASARGPAVTPPPPHEMGGGGGAGDRMVGNGEEAEPR